MKCLYSLLLFLLLSFSASAQTELKEDFIPAGVRQYQFNLPREGTEIKDLQYVPSGEPVKGTLSPDGKRVILENYRKGCRVKLNVNYKDGTSEELVKSPCFIDPVSYEL